MSQLLLNKFTNEIKIDICMLDEGDYKQGV